MSHYRTEILLPPQRAADVEKAVAEILAPFENGSETDPEPKRPTADAGPADWNRWADEYRDWAHESSAGRRHAFWDFYTIGGRWAGQHVVDRFDPDLVQQFYGRLADLKVTVSGVQFGKQELAPASQIPMVDQIWQEMFPGSGLDACPMFAHSNPRNQGQVAGDVCPVAELGEWAEAERLIVGGASFDYDRVAKSGRWTFDKLEAREMVERRYWNGVSWNDSSWDGRVRSAVDAWNDRLATTYAAEYAALHTVTGEWLAVTVDYHS